MRIYNQPAYLLHSRPFRDTSLLLDFLTRDFGRISLIGKGVRQAKSKNKGLLQLFTPLHISYTGKSELKTLTQVELAGTIVMYKADRLFSAMYINELMVKLIHSHEVDPHFFDHYENVLQQIMSDLSIESVLRSFEIELLESLGYGLIFDLDVNTGEPIKPDKSYVLLPDSGFTESDGDHSGTEHFSGKVLLAISTHDFSQTEILREAKILMRILIAHHLGGKPLKSRLLFGSSKSK